jgi:hypothetical protein
VPICLADLEACLARGTKETQAFVEGYSLVYIFLVMTNELHLDECYYSCHY